MISQDVQCRILISATANTGFDSRLCLDCQAQLRQTTGVMSSEDPPLPYLLSCRAARKLQGHWSEGPQVGLHDQVKVGDVGLSHEGQAGERGQRGGVRAL